MAGHGRRVSVLGVPTSAGSHNAGQERAPAAWRAAGLIDALRAAGLDVEDRGDLPAAPYRPVEPAAGLRDADRVAEVARRVAAEVAAIREAARLLRDAPFFDDLAVRGRRPILALLVEVEQIFFHCPKAFMRSQLWEPDSWRPDALPSHATLTKRVMETPETLEELEEHYAVANYSRLLY